MIRANDIKNKETGLRAMILKFKKWIEGSNIMLKNEEVLLTKNEQLASLFEDCPYK